MTTEETSIPSALGVFTPAFTASVTAATSPVRITKDFPPMPVPRRTSTRSTSAALTAASALKMEAVTEKYSITPTACIWSGRLVMLMAWITWGWTRGITQASTTWSPASLQPASMEEFTAATSPWKRR